MGVEKYKTRKVKMKVVGPMEKTDEKAIQFEVVLEEKIPKKVTRPKAAHGRGSPSKRGKENPSKNFTETVQLCCLTMTAGPGTAFGDYKIPEGVKCSVCGSGLKKGRM